MRCFANVGQGRKGNKSTIDQRGVQVPICPLYWPPASTCTSLGLYSRETRGEDGMSVNSGEAGFSTRPRDEKKKMRLEEELIWAGGGAGGGRDGK